MQTRTAVPLALLIAFGSANAQDVSALGRPDPQTRAAADAAANQETQPAQASGTNRQMHDPETSAGTMSVRNAVGSASYDSSTNTVVLGNGSRVPMTEMAPGYNSDSVAGMEGVNPSNYQQRSAQAGSRLSEDTSASGQAYRSSVNAGAQASTSSGETEVGGQPIAEPVIEPNGPGSIGLSPSLYFAGGRPTAIVQVILTGGYGPASVDYRTTGGSAPAAWYRPVAGVLRWGRGERGTKTFGIPLHPGEIAASHTSGEVDFEIYGATGGQLAGATSGRVVLSPKVSGINVSACGTAGVPCAGMGSVLPGTSGSGPVQLLPPALRRGPAAPCSPSRVSSSRDRAGQGVECR